MSVPRETATVDPRPRRKLEFRILGPVEVLDDGRPLPLGGLRRALLALLLVHANEPVSTERLIDALWDEQSPATAPKIVQNTVSQLRKLLGADALVTRGGGYELRVDPEQLDAERFERLADEGRELAAAEAAARLGAALALWRGPALADFVYAPFAHGEIARLEERRLTATEDLLDARLELGHHAELVAELGTLVEQQPLRERLRGQLMLALYRSGRQSEALAVYHETRKLLVDELGIEPGPALQRLERAILRHDAELEPAVSAAAAPAGPPEPEGPIVVREVRRTVTVVACSPVTSGTIVDAEAHRAGSDAWTTALTATLERHGGTVGRLPTGALLAVFGLPLAHEDDVLRAARAAVELSAAAESAVGEDAPSGVRVGIETGTVIAGGDEDAISGLVVERAARLEQRAGPGEVLAGAGTARLVRDAARLEAAGEDAWRIVDVLPDAEPITRRLDAPLVGRERELDVLRDAYALTRSEQAPLLFSVLGSAGIGKSRLARELAENVAGEATVLTGRCLPYGDGITFWPLREILLEALGADVGLGAAKVLEGEPDAARLAERVAAAVGAGEAAASREELLRAVRKLLEALARERPLVLLLEDLHWAEPTFLDLVEHIAEWAREPILLLCLARPELLEQRPLWAGGGVNVASAVLAPLSDDEADRLMANLVGGTALDPGQRSRIAEAAGGNPLFLEQMLAMLGENPAAAGDSPIPPTLGALLAARLDRLEPTARAALERASIAGQVFWRGAVLELSPEEEREGVDGALRTLVHRELVRPAKSSLPREDAFRFHHMLIREAAYDSIPKSARANLHERFAAWLAHAAGDGAAAFDEILGYHLEHAFQYRAELGEAASARREVGLRAAQHLAAAGRRAYGRGDVPATVGLLRRAVALFDEGAPARLELVAELGEALGLAGEFAEAEATLAGVAEAADAAGQRALAAHARVGVLRLRLQTDPGLTKEALEREARAAIAIFADLGDEMRLAKAWELLAWPSWYRGRAADTEEAVTRALDHARRAGDARTEAQALNLSLGAALFGPLPVPEAIVRCREVLAQADGRPRIEASALRALAGLRAMEGAFGDARRHVERSRELLQDLGLLVTAAHTAETSGTIELLAGDAAAAERELRGGLERLEAMGETLNAPNLAAMLAQALSAQGRDREALALTELAEQDSTPDDLSAEIHWRSARGKVLARLGRPADAEPFARSAVALAEQTDFLNVHADALLDLAEVLRAARRVEEAREAATAALRLYERKGNAVAAAAARAFVSGTRRG